MGIVLGIAAGSANEGTQAPPQVDLSILIQKLEQAERAPAQELLRGYRIRYEAVQPDRILVQVESRGATRPSQRETLLQAGRERATRAQQLAREERMPRVRVSLWLDGQSVEL
jgi:type IV secretory pathway VirD2 relaxase